jgi:hypothetical protein
MRPIADKTSDFDTKALSSHEKKIQKRVVSFMKIVEGLAFSQTGKLTILKFLLDKTTVVLSETKAANKFNDKFHHFTDELDLAVRKSKKEENQQEFLELLQDRLARDGLGKHYKEYVAMKGSGVSTAQLIEWISEKQNAVNPPKVKQRSHSQPAMFISAQAPAQAAPITTAAPVANLPSSAPVFIALPQVVQPAMQPFYPNMVQQPVAYPAVQYPFATPAPQQPFAYPATQHPGAYPATPPSMGYQQAFPATAMANQPQVPPAANSQPQPQGSSLIGLTTVQAAFAAVGTLDTEKQEARDKVLQNFDGAKFNRKGTITLLKYLVNSELPTYSEKPEVKRFNDKLGNFINSYEKIRVSLAEQRNTRWAFECVTLIAQKSLDPAELVTLMDKLISEDRESIAKWLNTLY